MNRICAHIRSNLVAYVALFLALTGAAYASGVVGRNSVNSASIQNGQVKSVDVRNNGLTGADIKELTLRGVPGKRGPQGRAAPVTGGQC